MARLMAEISPRIGTCYHAAAANWSLERYTLGPAVKITQAAVTVRPKYRTTMAAFISRHRNAVQKEIGKQDFEEFRVTFDSMTAANTYHEQYGHPYICWWVPPTGPAHLDLTHRE